MATYLKGIGDAATRVNEIMPSLDAKINKFIIGHISGIINGEYNNFSATVIDRGIIIRSGLMQAYGYFGCSDTDTQFNFIMPSTTNYIHIYAEIDLSVVPNRFEIKQTAMSNTSEYTFRQDNLGIQQNGKYQMHLWQITLTPSAITLSDMRQFIEKPFQSVNAENAVTAETANALSVALNAELDSKYVQVHRLMAADTAYNAKNLSDNVTYTIQAPSDSGDIIIVQGMLTCANKFWVMITLRRDSFLGYSQSSPALYYLRSVNGQTGISYGFLSLEASLSGNSLSISGWKINQYSNNYSDSHARASGCYFALHSVYELVSSNK